MGHSAAGMRTLLVSVAAAVVAAVLAGTGAAATRAHGPKYTKALSTLATLDRSVTQAGTDGIAVQNALVKIGFAPSTPADADAAVTALLGQVSSFFSDLKAVQAQETLVWKGLKGHKPAGKLKTSATALGSAIVAVQTLVAQIESGFQAIAAQLGDAGTAAGQAVSALAATLATLTAPEQALAASLGA